MSNCLAIVGETIEGTILNATDGEPIIGASVVIEGTSVGTITNFDGSFSLETEVGTKLMVSYVGMHTQSVPASKGMVVRLGEDTKALDEVLVVAFGTATKKSYTGSASVVKTEDITKRQASNITNALAGQVAGIQGFSTSGQPGTTSSIQIRGIGSMSASSSPLYVVDGIPANGEAISTLSSNDIESVTVLKDAASNALYGARGSNGVILVTTRRGNTKDAQVTVDAKWGTNQRGIRNYNVMTDPAMYYETQYRALYNGALYDSQLANGDVAAAHSYANKLLLGDKTNGGLGYSVYTIPDGERLVGTNFKLNPQATLGKVVSNNGIDFLLTPDDWYDELFKGNNLRQEYNVSVSGSTDKINYFVSASYLDDTGIIENSGFRRVTARTNVNYQAKKWLNIGTSMNYTHANMKYPGESEYGTGTGSTGNIFYVSTYMAPIYPFYVRNADGSIYKDKNGYTVYDFGDGKVNGMTRSFVNQSNPAQSFELDKELYKKDNFNGKWFVEIEPYKGLKATANVGMMYQGMRWNNTANPWYGQFASFGGLVNVSMERTVTIDQQYLLTYNNRFADMHQVDILVGYENYSWANSDLSGSRQKIFVPDVAELNNAISAQTNGSSSDYYRTQSILAQVKYAYGDKYFVSASYSRMASSRFLPGHQWGNFWSVGLAWDMKGEKWLNDIEPISLLKLKASYGAQGNDALGAHPASDHYTITDNNGSFATALTYKGNPDLTWETSYNFNGGVDFGFFNDRLTGTIEGWRRRTVDMLYFKPVPQSLGYESVPENIAEMSNAGIDLELRGIVYQNKNITWDIYFNLSHFKNKILKLAPELNGELINGGYLWKEGYSMYNRRIKRYAGVDEETGKPLWYTNTFKVDKDGNKVKNASGNYIVEKECTGTTSDYSSADYCVIGDILPKVNGGFGTNLYLYGVDISLAFNYQAGGKIYDSTYANLMHPGNSDNSGRNWHADILKAWTPENPHTNVPRLDSQGKEFNSNSDRFLVSSNYVTLQNITVGYSFPKKWMEKIKLQKIRLYAVADNVALWAYRQGLDPRQGYSASNTAETYSPLRSISAGINIVF